MTIIKDWKCWRCNSEIKEISSTFWETYICDLNHLNFKWKEDEENNEAL